MSEPIRCPACGELTSFRRLPPRGLWERGLTRVAGLRPHRCEACGKRILRRVLPVGVAPGSDLASEMRAHPPFVDELDTDKFGELIEEIAAAERRREAEERPGS